MEDSDFEIKNLSGSKNISLDLIALNFTVSVIRSNDKINKHNDDK